jgi:hypothetical protein
MNQVGILALVFAAGVDIDGLPLKMNSSGCHSVRWRIGRVWHGAALGRLSAPQAASP